MATVDLSKYLQKRFERQDLRLSAEYRARLGKSHYEIADFDEAIEQWADRYERQGFLLSFRMNL